MKQRQRERWMFVKIKERRFGEIKSENGGNWERENEEERIEREREINAWERERMKGKKESSED